MAKRSLRQSKNHLTVSAACAVLALTAALAGPDFPARAQEQGAAAPEAAGADAAEWQEQSAEDVAEETAGTDPDRQQEQSAADAAEETVGADSARQQEQSAADAAEKTAGADPDRQQEQELIALPETESPVNFEECQEINSDIYAWIELPGTVIDYPVLQSVEDQEFYLQYDATGEENIYGAIFSQNCNRRDFTDFLTILYGHNMRDGSMFGSLYLYADPDVMWNNKYIYIYLPEITLKYEIFAAYPRGNRNLLYGFKQNDIQQRLDFLEEIGEEGAEAASFDSELFSTLTEDSHLLILSTCYQGNPIYRFVVEAVLVEEYGSWNDIAVQLGLRKPETEKAETEAMEETEKKETETMAAETEAEETKNAAAEPETEAEEQRPRKRVTFSG